jgi:hypothetical protein
MGGDILIGYHDAKNQGKKKEKKKKDGSIIGFCHPEYGRKTGYRLPFSRHSPRIDAALVRALFVHTGVAMRHWMSVIVLMIVILIHHFILFLGPPGRRTLLKLAVNVSYE